MLITAGLVAAASNSSFSDILKNTSNLYFVLLGGPYAAAIFAKVSVSSGVQTGRVQKTQATGTGAGDIVSNDQGSTDLYDFQYTLFNLVAIIIVIFLFGAHPGQGFPAIPDFLAILTGGSALTYTVNKGVSSNAPSISDVQPSTARIGDTVTVTGTNLLPPAAKDAVPTVSVGGVPTEPVTLPGGSVDTIEFTVPAPATGAWSPQTAQQVAVTTTAGVIATLTGALTIVEDRLAITHVVPPRFKAGEAVSVRGAFLLAPGTPAADPGKTTDSPGGLTGQVSDESGAITWPVQFTSDYSDSAVTVKASPPQGQSAPATATAAKLTLTRAGQGQVSVSVTIAPSPPA